MSGIKRKAEKQIVALRRLDLVGMSKNSLPYTEAELDRAQEIYDIVFPPDLRRLLILGAPLLEYDWRTDNARLRDMLRWPYEGLLFDVENNDLWLEGWGERPETAPARAENLRLIVADAPKLIPLYGHRYLPAYPCEEGNPVFSVYQSDIIYYGVNLEDYMSRESHGWDSRAWPDAIKRIPFWSDLIDYNNLSPS